MPRTKSTAFGGLVSLADSTVLGRLMPRAEHVVLGGLPLSLTGYHDFHAHATRFSIEVSFSPPARFVARVSASIATPEGCTGRGSISAAADTAFASLSGNPSRVARAPQKHWLQRDPSHSRLLYHRVLHRTPTPPRQPVRMCPSPPCLAPQPLHRRRVTDEQQQ